MSYVFGIAFRGGMQVENLKYTGPAHSDLHGLVHLEQDFADCRIVDDFRIVEKYRMAETPENCYDWYEITGHRRYIDYFTPVKAEIDMGIADSQDAVCTLSEDVEARFAEIEDALCEMSKEGGE